MYNFLLVGVGRRVGERIQVKKHSLVLAEHSWKAQQWDRSGKNRTRNDGELGENTQDRTSWKCSGRTPEERVQVRRWVGKTMRGEWIACMTWEEGKIWSNRRVMAEILSTQVQIAACACCSISKNRKLTPSVWVNFHSKQPRLNSLTKLELNMSASVCISTFMNLCHVFSLCAVDTAVHILPKMPCLFTNVVQAPRNSCKVVKPIWHSS